MSHPPYDLTARLASAASATGGLSVTSTTMRAAYECAAGSAAAGCSGPRRGNVGVCIHHGGPSYTWEQTKNLPAPCLW